MYKALDIVFCRLAGSSVHNHAQTPSVRNSQTFYLYKLTQSLRVQEIPFYPFRASTSLDLFYFATILLCISFFHEWSFEVKPSILTDDTIPRG